jgi:hypothetical protein
VIGVDDGVVERRDGAAFAGDFGGDALIDFRRQARFDEDGEFGLAEHVDEAGRDYLAGGIDGALAGCGGEIADGSDFSVADADVAGIPGEPVPSMMWPLVMTRSKAGDCAIAQWRKGNRATVRSAG